MPFLVVFGPGVFLLFIAIAFIYFLPTIIAFARGKSNRTNVFIVNFFFGWSIIGWIIALMLANKPDHIKVQKQIHRENMAAAKSNNNGSVVSEIEKLAELRDKGVLTEKEFKREKKKILK